MKIRSHLGQLGDFDPGSYFFINNVGPLLKRWKMVIFSLLKIPVLVSAGSYSPDKAWTSVVTCPRLTLSSLIHLAQFSWRLGGRQPAHWASSNRPSLLLARLRGLAQGGEQVDCKVELKEQCCAIRTRSDLLRIKIVLQAKSNTVVPTTYVVPAN